MQDISANSMLCFARSFHFLLPCRGTVHDFSLLSCSRTPFVLLTRVRLSRGTGASEGGQKKMLNLDKVAMSQMREEFLPLSGFVQLPSQGF